MKLPSAGGRPCRGSGGMAWAALIARGGFAATEQAARAGTGNRTPISGLQIRCTAVVLSRRVAGEPRLSLCTLLARGIMGRKGGDYMKSVIKTSYRLVKCYKLRLNYDVEEITYNDGSTFTSSCPFSACHRGESKPRCNGLNEFGKPCIRAYPCQDH